MPAKDRARAWRPNFLKNATPDHLEDFGPKPPVKLIPLTMHFFAIFY
jgi:hypothetical protein